MSNTCRHCGKGRVCRPRGLCWSCYYTPGVKQLYGIVPAARRTAWVAAPLPEPTQAKPGTPEKLEVLLDRARKKQSIYHPDDAR